MVAQLVARLERPRPLVEIAQWLAGLTGEFGAAKRAVAATRRP
jgi:hypothetical protein